MSHLKSQDSKKFSDSAWWYGEVQRNGRAAAGLFPAAYVVVPQPVRQQYNIRVDTGKGTAIHHSYVFSKLNSNPSKQLAATCNKEPLLSKIHLCTEPYILFRQEV